MLISEQGRLASLMYFAVATNITNILYKTGGKYH